MKNNCLERKVKVVALIPARAGSKGIPEKNKAPCAGRPLIDYTFEAAAAASELSGCYLSSDDPWIMRYAEEKGIAVPFCRPEGLAGDNVPMVEVMQHFLDWLAGEGTCPDAILLLQPTSPLRTAAHIDAAVCLFRAQAPASLVSVVRVPHSCVPESVMRERHGLLTPYLKDGPTRRQDKPVYFARNGPAILICTPQAVRSGNLYAPPCVGFHMNDRDSIDVDDPESLALAEFYLRQL